MRPVPDLTISV